MPVPQPPEPQRSAAKLKRRLIHTWCARHRQHLIQHAVSAALAAGPAAPNREQRTGTTAPKGPRSHSGIQGTAATAAWDAKGRTAEDAGGAAEEKRSGEYRDVAYRVVFKAYNFVACHRQRGGGGVGASVGGEHLARCRRMGSRSVWGSAQMGY